MIKEVIDGYKVCKKDDESECFSKKGLPLKRAKKQMTAINISEHEEPLEGGLKPISARIGGKVLLKKKIVDEYFPPSSSYKTYVEPFVGGGSIYFYKNKDGHKEVVNDLDPSVYQLFKGFQKYAGLKLADDVNGDYTEEDFNTIRDSNPKDDYDKFLKTYLLYKLSYFGKGERFGKPRINTKFTDYKERLENVDILNKDYKEVIEKYDSPSTFFYLDPPVRAQTGKFNFPAINIEELDKICKSIKGKFLLSLADKPNKELFKGFTIKETPTKYVQGRSKGGQSLETNEYLIMNYKPSEMSGEGEGTLQWMKDKNIDSDEYLKLARKAAKDNGYDPTKVHLSRDSKHKLYYDTQKSGNNEKEDAIHFGARDYNDYIIYTLKKNTNADKYRDAYRARATKIKGDWEKNKYSPNNLAINILW
jgi:DNA adenine methylase